MESLIDAMKNPFICMIVTFPIVYTIITICGNAWESRKLAKRIKELEGKRDA